MRILIYGAGVIGSFYASRFAKAGLDVTVSLSKRAAVKRITGTRSMVQRQDKNA